MQIRCAHHTGFTVANLDRSLAFYCDVLGLELLTKQTGTADYLSSVTGFPGIRLEMAFLKVPGEDDHILELLEYASHPAEPTDRATNRPGNGHLCFVVEDIWACYRELSAKGARFVSEPTLITSGRNRGARAAYFRDPDGFTLELYQPAPQPGADTGEPRVEPATPCALSRSETVTGNVNKAFGRQPGGRSCHTRRITEFSCLTTNTAARFRWSWFTASSNPASSELR